MMICEQAANGPTMPFQRGAIQRDAKDDQVIAAQDHRSPQTAEVRCHAGVCNALPDQ